MAEASGWVAVLRRALRWPLRIAGALALALFAAWAQLAVQFQAPLDAFGRQALGAGIAAALMAGALSLLLGRYRRLVLPFSAAVGVVVLAWWATIAPAQERDWAPDVARRSVITLTGDDVVARNVRVFDWTGEDTATERWEDRIYSLSDLRSLDLFVSTWGNDNIAHTIVSFSFGAGPPLALSIEIRKEKGEAFSSIAGFFKQYEVSLIAADESDVIKVRTNRRGEIVRRYRIDVKPENAAKLLAQYADMSQQLDAAPRFYHTVWTNCTTAIFSMLRAIGPADFPFDYRVLASGRVAEYLHAIGFIENVQPYDEIRRRADITMRAKLAETEPNFSAAIRR